MAFEGVTFVGLIEMIERLDDVLVENIAVDPDRQGRGIGKALLKHAEAVAFGRGTPVVRLYTNAHFAENLAFYRHRGFAIERQDRSVLGLTVHLVKALNVVAPELPRGRGGP